MSVDFKGGIGHGEGLEPAPGDLARRRRHRRRRSRAESASDRHPNIHSVAVRAGVSVVTVSRVFNDYPHIRPEVRARVFEAARALGYAPRVVSRQSVLGILVGPLNRFGTCDFESRLLMNIVRAGARAGYMIDIIPCDAAHLATQHFVSGLLAIGPSRQALRELSNLPKVPKVAINRGPVGGGWSSLCTDPFREAEMAVRHVAALGHTRVAMVLDDQDWVAERRREGFDQGLAAFPSCEGSVFLVGGDGALPVDVGHLVASHGYGALLNFSERFGMPILDAIVNRLGRKVPDDLSVIMLEHDSVTRHLNPPMTAVALPLRLMAEYAVSALGEQGLRNGHAGFETTFESRLIDRASVHRCP